MEKVLLLRFANQDTGSEGTIFFKGHSLLTLELPWRNNIAGKSCIPEGIFWATRWKSPTKGWCYRIHGAPNRDYILIHSANFAGDSTKGFRSDLLGCIALGQQRATYQGQRGLFISRPAVRFFNSTMDKQDFILEVKNAESYHIPV